MSIFRNKNSKKKDVYMRVTLKSVQIDDLDSNHKFSILWTRGDQTVESAQFEARVGEVAEVL
jgi:hypothetical protein